MDERRSDSSVAGSEGVRRRQVPWRGALVVLALVTGWMLPASVGSAQISGAQRACSQLQAALERVGDRGSARQALVSRLQRLGCPTTGPTTTFFSPTTTVAVCPLPGGGFGPCPTTTTGSPGTTVPGGPTTTGSPGTTFVPTTSTLVPPGGPTTVPVSTTLLPCSPTTTGQFPVTTIPCAP